MASLRLYLKKNESLIGKGGPNVVIASPFGAFSQCWCVYGSTYRFTKQKCAES